MKKTYYILALFLLLTLIACDEHKPGEMDPAGPRDSENPDKPGVEIGSDKYDENALADTSARPKGTAIQDTSSGLGGNKNPR